MAAANSSQGGDLVSSVVILHRGSTSGRLVRGYLEVEGHSVTEAASVSEGVSRIAQGSTSVLIVDVTAQWPPAPAYRQLLLAAERQGTPVIALVPHGENGTWAGQQSLTHLVKPFALADVGERVTAARATLRGRQTRSPGTVPAMELSLPD